MSKRAEEAALEAYPYRRATHFPDGFQEFDRNAVARTLFQEGYEQAEKDTIERAVAWLEDYVKYFELYDKKGIEEFRKAMEEQK